LKDAYFVAMSAAREKQKTKFLRTVHFNSSSNILQLLTTKENDKTTQLQNFDCQNTFKTAISKQNQHANNFLNDSPSLIL